MFLFDSKGVHHEGDKRGGWEACLVLNSVPLERLEYTAARLGYRSKRSTLDVQIEYSLSLVSRCYSFGIKTVL